MQTTPDYRDPLDIPYAERPATAVVFRRYPKREGGSVIALFPYEFGDYQGYRCICYQHVGQHGAANYAGTVYATKAAKLTDEDVMALTRELEHGIGYRLVPVLRRDGRTLRQARTRFLRELAAAQSISSNPN